MLTWLFGWTLVSGSAEELVGAGGDHLVGVHVRGGAGPGLEDVERELVVPLPLGHFERCQVYGVGDLGVEQAQAGVDLGARRP